jgi:hypothetical protein
LLIDAEVLKKRLEFIVAADYAWYNPEFLRGIREAIITIETIEKENSESS